MGWLCTGCGELHRDSFETCWKCGRSRDEAPAAPDPEDDESDLPQLSPEAMAHEREAIHRRAAEIMVEAARDGDYQLSGGLLGQRGADYVRLRLVNHTMKVFIPWLRRKLYYGGSLVQFSSDAGDWSLPRLLVARTSKCAGDPIASSGAAPPPRNDAMDS